MNTWTLLKDLVKKKLPDKKCFYRSLKDGTTSDNDEKLNGHVSDKEYLTCIKIWNEFNMKNMGDYHDHYLKKDVLLLADVFEKFIDTFKVLQTKSLPLLQFSWIELGCNVKNEWCGVRKNFRRWHVLIYWKRITGRNFLVV